MIPVNPYALADAHERAGRDGWILVPEIGYVRRGPLGPVLDAATAKRGRAPHPKASIAIEGSPLEGSPRWLVFTWPAHSHPRGGRSRGATIRLRIHADPVIDDAPTITAVICRAACERLRERDPSRGVRLYQRAQPHGRYGRLIAVSQGSIAVLALDLAEPSEVPRAT